MLDLERFLVGGEGIISSGHKLAGALAQQARLLELAINDIEDHCNQCPRRIGLEEIGGTAMCAAQMPSTGGEFPAVDRSRVSAMATCRGILETGGPMPVHGRLIR